MTLATGDELAGDELAGDEAADGLGLGAGVVVSTATGGAALGVVLGPDRAGPQADPSKAMAINKRRMTVSISIARAARACYVAKNAYVRCRS